MLTFDREKFRLGGPARVHQRDELRRHAAQRDALEAFLGFERREFLNPSDEQKLDLVERDGKWWRADEAVFGLRIFTIIKPGLQNDPLLKKVMPGSAASDDRSSRPPITLDSVDGLYLGDGQGSRQREARPADPVQLPGRRDPRGRARHRAQQSPDRRSAASS